MSRSANVTPEKLQDLYYKILSQLPEGELPTLYSLQKATNSHPETLKRLCQTLKLNLSSGKPKEISDDMWQIINAVSPVLEQINHAHKKELEKYKKQIAVLKEEINNLKS